jgi:hypothetical protein
VYNGFVVFLVVIQDSLTFPSGRWLLRSLLKLTVEAFTPDAWLFSLEPMVSTSLGCYLSLGCNCTSFRLCSRLLLGRAVPRVSFERDNPFLAITRSIFLLFLSFGSE